MTEQGTAVRVGVIAADPLRLLGLQTILEEGRGFAAVSVSLERPGDLAGLGALLVDASLVVDLRGMLAELRRDRPHLPVVVMGASSVPEHIQAVIASGARGYLAPGASESEIHMAMDVVLGGSVWAPRKVLARLLQAGSLGAEGNPAAPPVASRLTSREGEVMKLLLAGQSNRQIAQSLGVDTVTVKAHLGRMFRKAGVKNRVELTAVVHAEGLRR